MTILGKRIYDALVAGASNAVEDTQARGAWENDIGPEIEAFAVGPWSQTVIDKDLTTPPVGVDGARYIVPSGATGVWVGRANDIAEFEGGSWFFTSMDASTEGTTVWVEDENRHYVWDGTAWITLAVALSSDALYKPGLAGGQIAHGGTGAGEDLILRSTTNPTKGDVLIEDSDLVFTGTSGGWRFALSNGALTQTGGGNVTIVGPLSTNSMTVEGHATFNDSTEGIDHTDLDNIGVNTHAQIDIHISDGSIHFTEASIDHGNISGLSDDDHPGYLWGLGRAGGQTLYGGTSADDDLILRSSSNAAKGSVRIEEADHLQLANDIGLKLGDGLQDFVLDWSTAQATAATTVMGLGTSNSIILTASEWSDRDHDHGNFTHPTIVGHADSDPDLDNSLWWSIGWSTPLSGTIVQTGNGPLSLRPSGGTRIGSGTPSIGASPDNFYVAGLAEFDNSVLVDTPLNGTALLNLREVTVVHLEVEYDGAANEGRVRTTQSGDDFYLGSEGVDVVRIDTAQRTRIGSGTPSAATDLGDLYVTDVLEVGGDATFLGAVTGIEAADLSDFNESAQDAVGGILVDTSTVDLTYNDAGNQITADVVDDSITFGKLQNLNTDVLIGRDAVGSGDATEISVGGGLEFDGANGIRRAALTGDVTASAGSGATTIAANAVLDTMLRDSAARSVIGRSAGTAGDPADITAGADGDVLHRAAGVLAFGQLSHTDLGSIGTNTHAQIDTHIADATFHFTEASIDHGSITGLSDDDHPGHLWGLGRSGGQTQYGGIASGDDLVLRSTSHATKGDVRVEESSLIFTGTLGSWTFALADSALTQTGSGLVTFTGQLRAADGVLATPGMAFGGNPDTGFALIGDSLAIVDDGVNVMQFDAAEIVVNREIELQADVQLVFGNGFAQIDWSTAPSADGLILGLGNSSNSLVVCQYNDRGTAWAHGNQDDPSILIQSSGTTTADHLKLSHSGDHAIIQAGSGIHRVEPAFMAPQFGFSGWNRGSWWQADGTQATPFLTVEGNQTGQISYASSGTYSAGFETGGYFAVAPTGVSIGNETGWGQADVVRRGDSPLYYHLIAKMGASVTSARWYAGFVENAINAIDNSSLNTFEAICFEYDADTSDTNWYAVTSNGTSQNRTDTGIAVTADTVYEFSIFVDDGGTVYFYIDGSLVATTALNLPATTTLLDVMWGGETRTAAAREIKLQSLRWASH